MSNRTIPIHDGSRYPSLQACVRPNFTVDIVAVSRLALHIARRRGSDFWPEFRRQQIEAQHLADTRRERAEIEAANARLPLRGQLIASLRLELEIAEHGLAQPLDHDKIGRLRRAIEAAEAVS